MADPGGLAMLKRFYVEGQHPNGSTSFGIPIDSLDSAQELCRRRHERGYRQLCIHDSHTHRVCRWSIQYGPGRWVPEGTDGEVTAFLREAYRQ